nr:uncharacterized mitochondrial protein AtMg00810-like [Tanacetum cinerariifolium]
MHKAFPLLVMEFPLPEDVPTASEESSHCQKKGDATTVKIALLLKLRKFGDSYEVPGDAVTTGLDGTGKKKGMTVTLTTDDMKNRKNDVKARTTLLLSLPDEHQLRFKGSETLEQTFNRLQVIVSHLEFMDIEIKQDDLNQKFLTSLAPEWLMHTIVWRNRSDLDIMSLDDLYNHLKIDEDDVEKMDIKWNMALLSIKADRFWKKTEKKITIQGSDVAGFDKSKVECFNCDKMGHFVRECRDPRSQDKGKRDNYRQGSKVEEQTPKALIVIDGVGWDWNYMENDEENHALVTDEEAPIEFALMAKTSAESEVFDNSLCSKASTDRSTKTKTAKVETAKPAVKYAVMYSKPSKSSNVRGNQRNWNNLKSYQLGGCKITGKRTIKTDKLEFENVYLVKYLKYNMFSVSQIYDNKNSVLFTNSECIVLVRDFKLLDDANVLLRTPRQHNMYSIDLNNIVPHKDLTCLVAKASADEGMLWHRRLGHLNFKTMNRLVRHNLVRGLPSKCFKNEHTCTACLKGKQHKASLTDDFSRFTWTFFLKTKDETSGILRKFITEIENLKDLKLKIIRTLIEAARTMLADAKLPVTFWAEAVNTACYVQNRVLVNKSLNKTLYELFNGRTPAIGFLKPFGCHVMILNTLDHLGKFKAKGDEGFFIGYSMSSKAFRVFNKRTKRVEENLHVDFLENKTIEKGTNSTNFSSSKDFVGQDVKKDVSFLRHIALPNWVHDALLESSSSNAQDSCKANAPKSSGNPNPTATSINPPTNQLETLTVESPIPTVSLSVPTACLNDSSEPSIYQMDVKSAFLYGTIDEEVYVIQPPRFQDPEYSASVYKVEKAMYGLHQAPRAWYGTLSKYLLTNGFQRGTIDQTLFIKRQRGNFILVQIYVDDIIFGSSNPQLCKEFKALMHEKFQMSAMGELNFFLGLQVLQKEDGIFLSQDKYVGDILKKFRYSEVRSSNTPMDKENPWGKEGTGKDVDLHLYRSMIGSLMYLTASRPDIIFTFYACVRHQVTPKECYLHAVKRIFRDIKGHPKLGLWYSKESPFDLVAYSDSDYGGATQDHNSTTGGCHTVSGWVIGTSKYWGVLRILMISLRLIPLGKGSGTPTESHHTPSLEAEQPSPTTHSSLSLPPITTVTIPPVIPTESLPIVILSDNPLSGNTPRELGLLSPQFLYLDSTPRVTSLTADEGSMQHKVDELTALCTSLQRQQSEMVFKFEAQELEINRLKAKIKLLEDKDRGVADQSGDDAPIKRRRLDEGEEAVIFATAIGVVSTASPTIPTDALIEWKLYDTCGVHHVTSKDKEIFMLVEKDYPLKNGLAIVMICYKLQLEHQVYGRIVGNKMHKAFPLPVMEFPLPVKKVPTARRKEMLLL